MSMLAQVLSLFPAVAAAVVLLLVVADRRESARLNSLRDLPPPTDDARDRDEDLESSAA